MSKLVLMRRSGENIRIGDEIVVTTASISGNLVRLGITALEHVPIHRSETASKYNTTLNRDLKTNERKS